MDLASFKILSDHNKARQIQHVQENKEDIIDTQELDHQTMIKLFIETRILSAINYAGTNICSIVRNKLRSRICNDMNYEISHTSSEVILSSHIHLQKQNSQISLKWMKIN